MIKTSIFCKTYPSVPMCMQQSKQFLDNGKVPEYHNKSKFAQQQMSDHINQEKHQSNQKNQQNNLNRKQKNEFCCLQANEYKPSLYDINQSQLILLKKQNQKKIRLCITGVASKHSSFATSLNQSFVKNSIQEKCQSRQMYHFQTHPYNYEVRSPKYIQERINSFDTYKELFYRIKALKQLENLDKAMNERPKIKIRFQKKNKNNSKQIQREFLYKQINFQRSSCELRDVSNKEKNFRRVKFKTLPKSVEQADKYTIFPRRSEKLLSNTNLIKSKTRNKFKENQLYNQSFKQNNHGLMIKSYIEKNQKLQSQHAILNKHNQRRGKQSNKTRFLLQSSKGSLHKKVKSPETLQNLEKGKIKLKLVISKIE